jgi:two-component system chemotaxis response regulator CheY
MVAMRATTDRTLETIVDTAMPILVVDDSRSMTRIMATLLAQIGYSDVDQVNDGASALQSLRSKRYGLVISDWEMQPMNGPELVHAVRDDPALAATPVILVTTEGARDDGAWLSGADGFLPKPFTPIALRDKIEEVLARSADEMKAAG